MSAARLIAFAARRGVTAAVPWTDALEADLAARCDDSAQYSDGSEYWGHTRHSRLPWVVRLNRPRVRCRCGDGSCMLCDDDGMVPAEVVS